MIARLAAPWLRLHDALVMGRKARVDCFQTVADLLDAGFELERALDVTALALGGRGARARLIGSWRTALPAGRFAQAMAASVPAAEAMIFEAYGRVDAGRLFAAAARVAELRERQMAAVRKALAVPVLLGIALVLMLWAAGGWFVPVLESVVPPERWGPAAALFRAVSLWLFAQPLAFAALCAAVAVPVGVAMVHWTGPGRDFKLRHYRL